VRWAIISGMPHFKGATLHKFWHAYVVGGTLFLLSHHFDQCPIHIIHLPSPFWYTNCFLSTSIRVFYFWVKATWDKGVSTLAFPILLFVGIHALECGRGSKHARCLKIVSKCCFNKILCVDVHYMCIFDHLFLPHPKSKWSNFFSLVSYGCLLSTFLFY
jgi:hypothetical protein